jgi:hypothetical protein
LLLVVGSDFAVCRPGIGVESPECGGDAECDLLVGHQQMGHGALGMREQRVDGLGTDSPTRGTRGAAEYF